MSNYANFLSKFDFDVVNKASKENINADYLSRIAHLNRLNKIGGAQSTVNKDGFDNIIIRQINPRKYPKAPWELVHIDYAGPFEGMMLLIISDDFSKWLDVKVTKSITASATITLLDKVFAAYGGPMMIVSDNGTNFFSAGFNNYLERVGVEYHKYTAPYHPATNAQAERNMQTVKNALRAMCTTRVTLNAPHFTMGQSPAQLFLGQQLRKLLDLVRPEETKCSKIQAVYEG
ncbi:uncharacterized protein K02A2.6-like [Stomoxys calcitrans]|uniref:uncharacterized protein K02A2.6-like n=1 Tax=Stomoxys calcitrans TaxID=35570 RepID=UPI0027E3689B|nr:uncharacterized protein K02A2.6-like [Stomoxys calcitrans]